MTADFLADLFGASDGPWTGNEPCTPPAGASPTEIREHADQWHPVTPYKPDPGKERAMAAEAKRLCGGCDKITACLAWALDHPDATGIYGATTDPGRKQLREGNAA